MWQRAHCGGYQVGDLSHKEEAEKPTEILCNVVVWRLESAKSAGTGLVSRRFMMVVEYVINSLESRLRAFVEGILVVREG